MQNETIVVVYKPHGTKIAIMQREFDPKVHEMPVEGKIYEPEIKENQEQSIEEMSLQDLNGLYFKLGNVQATGRHRINRSYLISRITQMQEEQGITLENLDEAMEGLKNSAQKEVVLLIPDDPVLSIEDLRKEYKEITGKNISPRYMNDIDWMTKKINEAKSK